MKITYNKTGTAILISLSLFLTSCAGIPQSEPEEPHFIPIQMEEAPILDYQVPELYPSILVDRTGYNAGGSKVAVVQGEQLTDRFRLVDKASGEVVYTGELEKRGYNEAQREYNSYGDFSEFTQAGEYYIECDVIGRSYSFRIADDLYQEVLDEAARRILKQAEAPDIPAADLTGRAREEWFQQMLLLLLSYELYPAVYTDVDNNQIPDILDAVTYMVKDIRSIQEQQTGNAGDCNYVYAAALAKYSYLYQKCDSVYATEVLNLAVKAWSCAEAARAGQDTSQDEEYRMLASAELYRATGQYKYRLIITEYGTALSADASGGDRVSGLSRESRLAMVTYISTRQRVDTNLCSLFMRVLMQEAEDISARAAGSRYLSIGDELHGQVLSGEEVMDELIGNIILLSVVEYIITNQEYGKIIENQYHYFMGRNPQAYCYWYHEDAGIVIQKDRIRLQDHSVWSAGFVMMLSEMITNR